MNRLQSLSQDFAGLFSRLSHRERFVVLGGALLLIGMLVYGIVLSPLLSQTRRYEELIPQKEKELAELAELSSQYGVLTAQLSAVESQIRAAGGFSILSFVEEVAAKTQVRGNIAYIRPLAVQSHEGLREVPVALKGENVTLSRLVGFLSSLEQAPTLLRVRRVALRTRFADPQYIDGTFVVSSSE